MECHLGWCVSFPFGFALEPFTRGLASENADQHSERFVAVITPRTLTCCASKPLIAPVSRTDHNAATPSLSLMFAPELSAMPIILRPSRNCRTAGGAEARSSPQPVRGGAKRSGLTAPSTAGQSVGVMAVTCGHQILSARTHEMNGTRGLENSEDVTG